MMDETKTLRMKYKIKMECCETKNCIKYDKMRRIKFGGVNCEQNRHPNKRLPPWRPQLTIASRYSRKICKMPFAMKRH